MPARPLTSSPPRTVVAVGTGSSPEQALERALALAPIADAPLDGRSVAVLAAEAVEPVVLEGVQTAARAAGAGQVVRVECPSADMVEIDLGGAVGRGRVDRTWWEADVRVVVGHNRSHRRWLYAGAMLTLLRAFEARGTVPEICRTALEAAPVAFAVVDAWESRDRRGPRATHAVLAGRSAFAVDWVAGEKMDIDPAMNLVVREGLLRWDRIPLDRRGNRTPWDPWANATAAGAVLADAWARVRGDREVAWTTR